VVFRLERGIVHARSRARWTKNRKDAGDDEAALCGIDGRTHAAAACDPINLPERQISGSGHKFGGKRLRVTYAIAMHAWKMFAPPSWPLTTDARFLSIDDLSVKAIVASVAAAVAEALGEPELATRQKLNHLFALNPKLRRAYLLKRSLDRLWSYHCEGAMLRCLPTWIAQPRWQRLKPFDMLARAPLDRLGDSEPLPDQGPQRWWRR
jgi:hypothetical protein